MFAIFLAMVSLLGFGSLYTIEGKILARSGVYRYQNDPNTVSIAFAHANGEFSAYSFCDGWSKEIEDIPLNTKVKITYTTSLSCDDLESYKIIK